MELVDATLQAPFTWLVAGPTGTGKSYHVVKALESTDCISLPISAIYWHYGIWQKLYNDLQNRIQNIMFIEGLPAEDCLDKIDKQHHNVIVIDDLMSEVGKTSEVVTKLFTRGSHHANVSVILITQNIYWKGGRDINLNANYISLFKNPRDMSFISTLAKQVIPGKEGLRSLKKIYNDATDQPFGYLFVDLKPNTHKNLRFRTNVFHEDNRPHTVYIIK